MKNKQPIKEKCFEKGVESSWTVMMIGFLMCLLNFVLLIFGIDTGLWFLNWFWIGVSGFFAMFINFFIMGDY